MTHWAAVLRFDWLLSPPVLRYTWEAGSLITSWQEEAELEDSPQMVVSG